jgi:hypothetical protein
MAVHATSLVLEDGGHVPYFEYPERTHRLSQFLARDAVPNPSATGPGGERLLRPLYGLGPRACVAACCKRREHAARTGSGAGTGDRPRRARSGLDPGTSIFVSGAGSALRGSIDGSSSRLSLSAIRGARR